jgi:hypothetical protein
VVGGEGTPEGFPLPVASLFAASAHMTGISAVLSPRCPDENVLGTTGGISYAQKWGGLNVCTMAISPPLHSCGHITHTCLFSRRDNLTLVFLLRKIPDALFAALEELKR